MIKTSLLEVLSIPRKIAYVIFLGMLFFFPFKIYAACTDVYTLKGIIATTEVPRILVNNEMVLINDVICEGQVIEIQQSKIRVLFNDEIQEFVVNDDIYYRQMSNSKQRKVSAEELEQFLSKRLKKKNTNLEQAKKESAAAVKNSSEEKMQVAVAGNIQQLPKSNKAGGIAESKQTPKSSQGAGVPKIEIKLVNQDQVKSSNVSKLSDRPFIKEHLSLIIFAGFLFSLIAYVVYAVSLQIICERYEIDSPWLAWIPGVNFILLLSIINLPWWCVFSLSVIFIPVVGIYLLLLLKAVVIYRITVVLQKPTWIALICLIPGGEIVAISCLAFDKQIASK